MEEEKREDTHKILLTIDDAYKIIDQMKKCICKIYKNQECKGTGFFCYIPYSNIPVLITNHYIINEDYIMNNKKINITLNDDKKNIIINIHNDRKIYSSEKYGITIIEIIPKLDHIYNYLEFEDIIINQDYSENYYENKSIYIIQYSENQKASVSFGILKEIREYNILHTCGTDNVSSGSPILDLLSKKIIGIHKEGEYYFNYNGTILKYPINKIINFNKIKNNNNKIDNIKKNIISKNDLYHNLDLGDIYKINNNNYFNYYNQIQNRNYTLNSTLYPISPKQKYSTSLKLGTTYIPKSMRESNYLKQNLGREINQKGIWEKDGNKINEEINGDEKKNNNSFKLIEVSTNIQNKKIYYIIKEKQSCFIDLDINDFNPEQKELREIEDNKKEEEKKEIKVEMIRKEIEKNKEKQKKRNILEIEENYETEESIFENNN